MNVLILANQASTMKVVSTFLDLGVSVVLRADNKGMPDVEHLEVVSSWRDRVDEVDFVVVDNPSDFFKVTSMDAGRPVFYIESGFGRRQLESYTRVMSPWLVDLLGRPDSVEIPVETEKKVKKRWWRRNA